MFFKDYVFSTNLSWHLCKKISCYRCVSISGLYFFSLINMTIFMLILYSFDYCFNNLISNLKSSSLHLPALLYLFKSQISFEIVDYTKSYLFLNGGLNRTLSMLIWFENIGLAKKFVRVSNFSANPVFKSKYTIKHFPELFYKTYSSPPPHTQNMLQVYFLQIHFGMSAFEG